MPRPYRVAVGQRISNECADILMMVARANAARGQSREGHITNLLERLDQAALKWVREALRFTPATENGVGVSSCKGFRVVFNLN